MKIREILTELKTIQESTSTIQDSIEEWESKTRSMGCVAATDWFCKRHPKFHPIRKTSYMKNGNDKNGRFYQHVVATDGKIEIDLSPYNNKPRP